ncbi:MAG: uroporphyrinogen-III C-methyltransferase, partial [Deltaproteobacteria bacterium]|nr:uroporphyrinogen-III C-methyltransferase [Deltaproteobacteria bacterium]
DLITRRGADLISRAEVLIYDHLASPELLGLTSPNCQKIYAGKIGSKHTLTQDQINDHLVKSAQKGLTVVRLKGGDPYIFGRGGEEALVLYEAGIDFEVIPGVSSSVAAPAAAGIPLTHRDLSSQVVIMTGHEKPGKERSAHDFSALARLGTIAVVMGAENLAYLSESLIAAGKDPDTPAAMIQWGYTYQQKTLVATLGSLPQRAAEEGLGPPSVVVIGAVVNLRSKLSWFERRPLFGRRIMVTMTRSQASLLSKALRELGGEVIERPVIEIEPIWPNNDLEKAFKDLSNFNWLVLTSPNGASIFMKSLLASSLDARALGSLKIAAIGPGTAEALAPFGLKADLMPQEYIAEGLVEAFSQVVKSNASSGASYDTSKPNRCLIARSASGREVLSQGLRDLGFEVTEVSLYQTKTAAFLPVPYGSGKSYDFLDNPPDLTTLTSASTAHGLAQLIPEESRHLYPTVSIGPITTQAAQSLGFTVVAQSQKATIGDLVKTITAFLGANR